MLKTLKLHNFRTYLNAEFSFTQRHLVIGKNNSGKSNLCAAIQFLRATAQTELATAAAVVPGGAVEMSNWAFKSDVMELSLESELPVDGQTCRFSYVLELTLDSPQAARGGVLQKLRVTKELLVAAGPGFEDGATLLENDGTSAGILHEDKWVLTCSRELAKTPPPTNATMLSTLYESESTTLATAFKKYISGWCYFTFSPEKIRHGWRDNSVVGLGLQSHGENLASVLYYLKNLDERRYRRIIDHVRLIEPDLELINFSPTPDRTVVPYVGLKNSPAVSWHGLSDGTLRYLALATVVELVSLGPGPSNDLPSFLVLIEEPENGIWPGQLRAALDMIEEWAPAAQFIFTSHSPYFINLFDGTRDSVTLLRRRNERSEVVIPPPPEDDPDRPLLAEQYSMELFD